MRNETTDHNIVTLDGIVIREKNIGENDKYLNILTENNGTIHVIAKGARKITSKNHAATQLFAFSTFCIRIYKEKFYLESSEIKHDFYNLRLDIKKTSLVCYFGELARYAVLAENKRHEHEILRLMLNCMSFLDKGIRSCEFIKSIFELRFVSEIGLIPQLIGCVECIDYKYDPMYFIIDKAVFYCEYCFLENGFEEDYWNVKISNATFCALQFIGLVKMERLFNFRVSDEVQKKLNEVTEKYVLVHIKNQFDSLDYYHKICDSMEAIK